MAGNYCILIHGVDKHLFTACRCTLHLVYFCFCIYNVSKPVASSVMMILGKMMMKYNGVFHVPGFIEAQINLLDRELLWSYHTCLQFGLVVSTFSSHFHCYIAYHCTASNELEGGKCREAKKFLGKESFLSGAS